MSVPLWAEEMASAFWRDAGGEEAFPRSLRRAVATALPVTVVLLPALRLASVDAWLRGQDILCHLDVRDRPLRACLVARYGQGMIFLDGADPEDEQRFSLAHEVAHFLKDYWHPRRRVADRLGPQILEILDGDRPARQHERIQALLAQVPIGFHVHLMDRTDDGLPTGEVIDTAEHDADLLAFELLAPAAALLPVGAQYTADRPVQALTTLLTMYYRLPLSAAQQYASILVPRTENHGSFIRRLGLKS